MDIRDFRIMLTKHHPWLLKWVGSQTGSFRLRNETDEKFEAIVAAKIESVMETPWKDLKINEETCLCTVPTKDGAGWIITSRYYTVVWRKNEEDKIRHTRTDKPSGLSVNQLLRIMLSECEDGDTPWVTAVAETVHTINTTSMGSPRYKFIVYPCDERAFMSWVDHNKDEINQTLAERGVMLSSYSVVTLNR